MYVQYVLFYKKSKVVKYRLMYIKNTRPLFFSLSSLYKSQTFKICFVLKTNKTNLLGKQKHDILVMHNFFHYLFMTEEPTRVFSYLHCHHYLHLWINSESGNRFALYCLTSYFSNCQFPPVLFHHDSSSLKGCSTD